MSVNKQTSKFIPSELRYTTTDDDVFYMSMKGIISTISLSIERTYGAFPKVPIEARSGVYRIQF